MGAAAYGAQCDVPIVGCKAVCAFEGGLIRPISMKNVSTEGACARDELEGKLEGLGVCSDSERIF